MLRLSAFEARQNLSYLYEPLDYVVKGIQRWLLLSLQSSWPGKWCPSDPRPTSAKVCACSTGMNWHLCLGFILAPL